MGVRIGSIECLIISGLDASVKPSASGLAAANPPAPKIPLVIRRFPANFTALFMKTAIHPKYVDAEIRCACGNVIKTRSTRATIIVGICNVCHPFYTGQQKFVDTAGRVDKFQQRLAKTQAAQAEHATKKKKKV
jgi:large subunit ribosomal protein L31